MINEPSWNEDTIEQQCTTCGIPLVTAQAISCTCAKHGYVGHEGEAWCSDDCLAKSHEGPEW